MSCDKLLVTFLTWFPLSEEAGLRVNIPSKRATRAEGQVQIAFSVLNRGGYACLPLVTYPPLIQTLNEFESVPSREGILLSCGGGGIRQVSSQAGKKQAIQDSVTGK